MGDEMSSLEQNHTWEFVEPLVKEKMQQNKWVYMVKHEANGTKKLKPRLVVKGFDQKKDIDFKEIFTSVVEIALYMDNIEYCGGEICTIREA